jgi:Zn-dependent protease with chaperone function
MLPDQPAFLPLVILVAIAPAAVRLWRDRSLARRLTDAALPERLLTARKQHRAVIVVCCTLLVALGGFRGLWLLPLLILLNTAAGYPLRKRLFEETWSLTAYLSFMVRLTVASFGFWILLGLTPALAGLSGTPSWAVPAVLGVILIAWNERLAEVLRSLLRVRSVADATLLPRFQALAVKAGVPMPRFEYVDLRGGFVANAVAVPSLRRASVVFTDALLARLEPDEAVAICAHEIAHLEHYNRRRLLQMAWVNRALIAGSAFLVPSASGLGGPASDLMLWLTPVAILANAIWRAKDRQRNETVSDQRAVALTGNPEALASGLTKLHTWGRVPRRFDQQHEQRATHPSLARRIRDIRAASGTAPVPLDTVTQIAAADGRVTVTFEPTRLRWTEGDAADHSLTYAALSELRVDASGQGPAKLVAVARGGHRWTMPLADRDTAAVQSVLDRVDGQLAHPAAAPRINPASTRAFALLATILALGTGQIAGAIVAALASLQPAPSMLVASGVACLTSALLALRGTWWSGSLTAILAIVGAGLIGLAWVKRGDDSNTSGKGLALLALLGALFLIVTLAAGLEPVRLYQSARATPAASILLVALAAALAISRRRPVRLAAIPIGCAGLALILLGSTAFLEAFGHDPLLISTEKIGWKTVAPGNAVAESTVPSYVTGLQLSPQGQSVIAWRAGVDDNDDEIAPATAYVGRIGDRLSPIRADAIAFIDETRVLAARFTDDGIGLTEHEIAGTRRLLWRQQIPGRVSGRLAFEPATQRWRVLGRDRDLGIVRIEGQLGTPDVATTRWQAPAPARAAWMSVLAASGDSLVAITRTYEPGAFSGAVPMIVPLLFGPRSGANIWHLTGSHGTLISHTLLEADCTAGVQEDRLVCAAFDGRGTRVVTINAADARVEPVGSLDGRFVAYGSRPANGWISGWTGSGLALLRVGSHRGVRLGSAQGDRIQAVAATDGWVAALLAAGTAPHIRLYRAD